MVQIASLLRKCYLFKNLPEENLKDFAQAAETKRYSKGDPIFLASEPSHRIYFIASGEVDIILNQRLSQGQKIRTLQSGEHMAELSVLTNSRHSVSAFAGSEVEVISIEGSRFVEVLHHHKDTCFSLAQTLAEQITINLKNSLSIRPLTEKKIHFSPLLSEIFPIGLIKKYQVVPLKILDKTIHIAVVLPLQDEFFSEYKKLNTNYDLQVSTIEEKDFEGLQQEFLAHIAGLQGKGATPDNRTENLFSSLEEMLPFSLMFSQLPKAVLDQVIPYFKAKKVKAGETIRAQGDEVQNLF